MHTILSVQCAISYWQEEEVVAYLEKVDKTVLQLDIIRLKKILKCRTEKQNEENDLDMDVSELDENINNMKNNAEQDEHTNEKSVN